MTLEESDVAIQVRNLRCPIESIVVHENADSVWLDVLVDTEGIEPADVRDE